MASASAVSLERNRPQPGRMRVFLAACGAHALHDGFTDTLYVLLPTFQTVFGLDYAAIGGLRALYTGTMAGLQVPSTGLSRRLGPVGILAAGTTLAGAGYLCLGMSGGLAILALALVLGGAGSSTQHPIASRAEDRRERAFGIFYSATIGAGALSPIVYGFAGDALGLSMTAVAIAAIVLLTLPLAWTLRPALRTGGN